jgi:hypothetical protein
MVDVEGWVAGRSEEVAAGIAAGKVLVLVVWVFMKGVDLPDHVVSTAVRADLDRVWSSL